MQERSGREWSGLKDVLEDALRWGIAMAKDPKHESAAEDQWHAVACTVQLAVQCLGIGHCTEKVQDISGGLVARTASYAEYKALISRPVEEAVILSVSAHLVHWPFVVQAFNVAAGQGAWHTGYLEGRHPYF